MLAVVKIERSIGLEQQLNFLGASLFCGIEYLTLATRGQEIPIPRTTLAVATAIFSAFPDLQNSENLTKLGDLSPLMIALNEAADIGISAEKRLEKGGLRQWQVWGLMLLAGETRKTLEKRISEFERKHPNERNKMISFINDFLTLSRLRDKFEKSNWPTFLEFDSAIFVAAYIASISPQTLTDAEININQEISSVEELTKKYSIFLIEQGEEREFTPIQQKIRALFASVMLLKTTDDKNDKNGSKVDRLLDLPNFWDYARSKNPQKPQEEINRIRERYHKVAEPIFPKLQQIGADILCSLTSIRKAEKAKNGNQPQDDPTNFWKFFQRESQTTTLRHELNAAQVLHELFR